MVIGEVIPLGVPTIADTDQGDVALMQNLRVQTN